MDLRAHLAQFGELAVRDYLRSKGMEKTMAAFDDELSAARAAGGAGAAGAPPSVDAWYSISRALDLPDLLHANSLAAERRYETILEVLLHELLQETNLKMRRPASLAIQRPNAPGARFAAPVSTNFLQHSMTATPSFGSAHGVGGRSGDGVVTGALEHGSSELPDDVGRELARLGMTLPPQGGAGAGASGAATGFSAFAPDEPTPAADDGAGDAPAPPAAPMGGLLAKLVKGHKGKMTLDSLAAEAVVSRRFTAKASAVSKAAAEQKKKQQEPQSKIGRRKQKKTFEELNKKSSEHWIPEEHRNRFIERNLAAMQINIEEASKLKQHHGEKARRQRLSDLETNLAHEKFAIARKKPCGCCGLEFSDVNLVLTVPYKAVVDLRTTWIEKFGVKTADDEKLAAKLIVHEAFTYDEVRICVQCAQFFQNNDFESYRPSIEKKKRERRAARQAVEDAATAAWWDPLTTVEGERRLEMEAMLELDRQRREGGGEPAAS